MSKLYKVIKTEEYGDYLTRDSKGKIVLEMRGGGGVKSFDSAEIEKVVPYTVGIQFSTGSAEKIYHYLADKSKVKQDSMIVFHTGAIGFVRKLDSKNEGATKWIEGMIFHPADELTAEENE